MHPWDAVKEWNYPYAKWFVNAKLNITANCLDRHVKNHRRNKVALIWKGEGGMERIYTYQKLLSEVMRFASGLKKIGVKKGDRVCIYMPMVPEQIIAMLACARIGAIHSVVFAGFGVTALNMRIREAEAKVVITADISIRRGKAIPLITTVQESILHAPSVEHLIIYRRRKEPPVDIRGDFEIDFYGLMEGAPAVCEPEVMDAEDPLFMLYTSGSTGSPKGIVHTCAGYMVGTYYTTKYVFDLKENDIYWCTADPGWITGHSYIVYGPLEVGATVFVTENTPDYPDPGIWWKLIEEQKINIFYTAPTAIRMFMKTGEEWPKKYDLSLPPRDRIRGRTPQPGGVRVVSPCDWRRPVPDRRYLVADRDRDADDHHHGRGTHASRVCRKSNTGCDCRCGGHRRESRTSGTGGFLAIKALAGHVPNGIQ